MRFCIMALFLTAQFVSAQDPAPPVAFPLETLRVEGNRRIPAEKIVAVAGMNIGSPVKKEDFDAARTRLLATGAFESVGYEFKPSADGKGYQGIFDVVEIDQLFPYRFEDLPISDETLRKELRQLEPILGDQIPATAEVLDRYAKAIEQIAKVHVTGKLNSDIPGQLAILFRPPTPRPNIAEVRFTGNAVLPTTILVNALAGVAIGVPYSETTLRLLLDSSVRPLYDARGRVRVAFPNITVEKSKSLDVDGVVVTVAVSEGPSYNLGAVRFAGVATADTRELEKTANFQSKDIANFDDIKGGLDRIYHRYRNKGYLRVSGRIDREIHDQEHTVDLTITLDPGPQFAMGKLQIAGLDMISEPEIRKAWALKTGSPFQPDYPDSFLNDIRNEGIFDNLGKTRAETQINDASKSVDVSLYFSGDSGKDQSKSGRKPGLN